MTDVQQDMTPSQSTSALSVLLRLPNSERTPDVYERVFDDFAHCAGGARVSDRFVIPRGMRNADYYFDFDDYQVLLELKQVNKYAAGRTVDKYFSKLIAEGRVRRAQPLAESRARIDPDSLDSAEWRHFYKTFRTGIKDQLDKASQQLKQTDRMLGANGAKPRFCGVLLVNTGDYELPLDLMYRLVEWRTKSMWKGSRYSKLDFVSCLTVDLLKKGQHPLQGRHIGRTADHALTLAIRRIYESWLHYYADAIGMKIEFDPDVGMADSPLQLSGQFEGKIRWNAPTNED